MKLPIVYELKKEVVNSYNSKLKFKIISQNKKVFPYEFECTIHDVIFRSACCPEITTGSDSSVFVYLRGEDKHYDFLTHIRELDTYKVDYIIAKVNRGFSNLYIKWMKGEL